MAAYLTIPFYRGGSFNKVAVIIDQRFANGYFGDLIDHLNLLQNAGVGNSKDYVTNLYITILGRCCDFMENVSADLHVLDHMSFMG